ncbi:MAG: CPBP family intramembrane metalloprotease, partial [Treponema sp.]|nr:CPBP family intramembrane metalloprotease [Treponema sp.]
VFTSALVGFKFAMLTKMTGSIFMGMGDHFVNNTIVNILHVVSKNGADQMMAVRVALAQSLSFILVLVWFAISSSRRRRK